MVQKYKNFKYRIFRNKASITFCDYTIKGTVSIPDTIENKPVTEIAEGAFNNCIHIEEIIIPNTVKIIGRNAFHKCESLKKINIPKGVTDCRWYILWL